MWKQYLHFLGPFDLSRRGAPWFGGTGEHPWHGLLALDLGREIHRPARRASPTRSERSPSPCRSRSLALMLATSSRCRSACSWRSVRADSATERAASFTLFALHSVPAFWAGLLLLLLFGATGLGWLPVVGLHDKDADLLRRPRRLGRASTRSCRSRRSRCRQPRVPLAADERRDGRGSRVRLRPRGARARAPERASSCATRCGTRSCRSSTLVGIDPAGVDRRLGHRRDGVRPAGHGPLRLRGAARARLNVILATTTLRRRRDDARRHPGRGPPDAASTRASAMAEPACRDARRGIRSAPGGIDARARAPAHSSSRSRRSVLLAPSIASDRRPCRDGRLERGGAAVPSRGSSRRSRSS